MSEEAKNTQPAELFAALAVAQGKFGTIVKNRSVTIQPPGKPGYSFRYADLEEILSKTREALSSNGLAVFSTLSMIQSGVQLSCVLSHSSGETVTSYLNLPKFAEEDPKRLGAVISYYRRYLVQSMLGVAADDDIDEDGIHPGDDATPQEPRQPARRTPPKEAPLPDYTTSALDSDSKAVTKAILAGRVTFDDAIKQIKTRFTVSESHEQQLRDAVTAAVQPLSAEQLADLRAKAEEFGISDVDLCDQFGLENIAQLQVAKLNAAMTFIQTGA